MLPLICITDFGWQDPYVGQVKGVLHQAAPGIVCIDLCHDIAPFAIGNGAWLLQQSLPYLPSPAVWLGVVDPGVGSQRRGIIISWQKNWFVGPDNGLFSAILDYPDATVWAINEQNFPHKSATFHGRDVFAPIAAQLACGQSPTKFGSVIHDGQKILLPSFYYHSNGDGLYLDVAHVDRYGNLITALPKNHLTRPIAYAIINDCRSQGVVTTFSSTGLQEAALVYGGFGTLELIVNQGNAAHWCRYRPGNQIFIKLI